MSFVTSGVSFQWKEKDNRRCGPKIGADPNLWDARFFQGPKQSAPQESLGGPRIRRPRHPMKRGLRMTAAALSPAGTPSSPRIGEKDVPYARRSVLLPILPKVKEG